MNMQQTTPPCIRHWRPQPTAPEKARCGFVYTATGCAGHSETHLGKEAAGRPSVASSRRKILVAGRRTECEVPNG